MRGDIIVKGYCVEVRAEVVEGGLYHVCIDGGFEGNEGCYINCRLDIKVNWFSYVRKNIKKRSRKLSIENVTKYKALEEGEKPVNTNVSFTSEITINTISTGEGRRR